VAADDDPVFDDDPERMYRTVRVLATALARRRAKIAAGIRVDPPPQCGCKKCADAGAPEDALHPPHQEHNQHDHQDEHDQTAGDVHASSRSRGCLTWRLGSAVALPRVWRAQRP
jgi:hypothetical protein